MDQDTGITPDIQGMRVSGKQWKSKKTATRRTFLPRGVKESFQQRKRKEMVDKAVKQVERELIQEKDEERQKRIQTIKERKHAMEEKEKLEMLAQKMSERRLKRLRKKQGRSKAING